MNKTTVRAFRIGGSIVLLAAVILLLPRGELMGALRQASPRVLVLAVTLFFLFHLAAAFKWRMLMGRSVDVPWSKAVRAHFSGLIGNLSPLGMIGGDLVRAGVAIKGSSHSSTIMVTSVVDRVVDTAALMILGLIGFLWIGSRSATAGVVLVGGFLVSIGGIAVLFGAHALLQRTQNVRLAGMRSAFAMLLSHPGLIARALVLSLLIQFSLISLNAYIGFSVGVDASFAAWLLAWPAAKVAGYVPVGFGGFGVRETALVALMAPFGGAAGPVLAAGLLWDAVLVVGSVGGWLLLSMRSAAPARMAPGVQKT